MMNDDDINNNGRGKYSYGYGYDEDGGGGDDEGGGEYYDGFENDDSAAYAYADPGAAAVVNDAAVVKVLSSPTRRRSNRRRVSGSSPVIRSRKQQSSPSLSPSLTNRKKHKQKMLGSSLLQHQFSTSSKDSGSGEISQNSQRSIDFAPSVPRRSTSVSPPASPVKVQQEDSHHHHHHHRDGTVIPAAPSSKDAKQQQGFWNVLAQARKKWEIQNNNNNTSDSRYHKQKKQHQQSLDTAAAADDSSHLLYLEGSSSHINFSYGGDGDDVGGDFDYHRRHSDDEFEDEEGGGSGPVSETLLPTNSAVIMDDGIRRHQYHEELHQRSSVHQQQQQHDQYRRSSRPALYDASTPAGPAVGSSSYNDDGNAAVDADMRWGDGSYSAMMMDVHIPGATKATGGGDNRSHHARPPKKPLQYHKDRRKKKKVMSAFSCMPTNTLLIGGQYYPGKDKKRSRHYMNTGIKHTFLRAFCGTPTRQTFSVIVTAYVLVYWLIVPIGEYLIFGRTGTARNGLMDGRFDMMGRQHRRPFGGDSGPTEGGWSNGGVGGGGRLFFDSGEGVLERLTFDSSVFVNLPPLQEELKYSQALYEARRNLLQPPTKTGGSGGTANSNPIREERLRLLESIVPEWYHRFDDVPTAAAAAADTEKDSSPNAGTDSASKLKEILHSNITKTTTRESKNAKQQQPQHLHHKKHRSKRNSDDPGGAIDKKKLIVPSPSKPSSNTTKYDVPEASIGAVTSRTLQRIGGLPTNGESGGDDLRLPLRTIHNMDEIGTKYSSCGRQQSLVDAKVGNATNGINDLRSVSELAVRSTTLVVQTSMNRLWILNETCTRWSHDPIVATVFIPYEEHRHSQQQSGDDKEPAEENQEQPRSLLNLADTLDCPNLKLVEYLASEDESQLGHYPVNRLRNVGLDQVTTDHVLVVDVDFVPSQDLDLLIRKSITYQEEQDQAQKKGKTSLKTALVVPAFEKHAPNCSTDEECASYLKGDSSFLPHTFDDLVKCYQTESEDCTIFQSTNNWEGHSTTRSEKWLRKEWYEKDSASNQTDAENNTKRPFREITCFDTARYEPYLVLEWCPRSSLSLTSEERHGHLPVSPYYDERFYGYGKNKIELVSHVRYRGYRLRVLPEGFIIHNPHLESLTKQTWNDRHQDLHTDMDSLYSNFLKELRTMYTGNVHTKDPTIQLCKRPNH